MSNLNNELKARIAAAGYEGYVAELIFNAVINKNVDSLLAESGVIYQLEQWYWAQAQAAPAPTYAPTSVEMWVQTLNYWANELRKAQPNLTQIAAVEIAALVFGLEQAEGIDEDHVYILPHTGWVKGSGEGRAFGPFLKFP